MQTNLWLRERSAPHADPAPLRCRAATDDAWVNTRRPPFDRVTISLHWATVLVVLTLFVSAWLHAIAEARQSDLTPALLQIHRSFGVTIWVLTALRLTWRLTNATLPPFPITMSKLRRATVKLSEYGLYALLLGQPVTGLLTTILGGRPFALFFWRFPPLAARDETLQAAFHLSHELGAFALGVLITGHAATALFHHFVVRDDVLECMAPVTRRHAPNTSTVSQST
jgi:superoxide oxidase